MKSQIMILLVAILTSKTMAQTTGQTLSNVLANATPGSNQLYDIYDLNVYNYYNLSEYDTKLKRSVYEKTADYQAKRAELQKVKEEMLKKTYYVKLKGAFEAKDYDLKRKGFEIEIGSDFAAYTTSAKPVKALYLGEEEESIVLKALPTKLIKDPYRSGGKQEMLFIPLDETNGLEIEQNRRDIEIYFLFTPSGKEKSTAKFSIASPPGVYNISLNSLKADTVRIVVANKSSGKVYYDKTFSYQPPAKNK